MKLNDPNDSFVQNIDSIKKTSVTNLTSKSKNIEDTISDLYTKNVKEDMKSKKDYANKLLNLLIWQCILIYVFVGLKLLILHELSDTLLITLITGTFGETIVLINYIVKYLFNNDLNKHFSTILKRGNNKRK